MVRHLRVVLMSLIAVMVVFAATACSGGSNDVTGSTTSDAGQEGQTSGSVDYGNLGALLEDEYGSAEWYPHVQWVGTDQVLLARVVRVETDLGMEDYGTLGEIANAIADILQSEDVVNIQVFSADGNAASGQSWGSEMGEVMDLPPAPTTAEELQSWIDTVYGACGEDWYGHIDSFSVSDTEAGWSGTTVIVVETDLPEQSDETSALARRIGQAVTSTGQTIADSYVVYTASGEHLTSGGLPSINLMY